MKMTFFSYWIKHMYCLYSVLRVIWSTALQSVLINMFFTYDVELQEVSETRGAIHPHQDSILQVCAEANG